MLLIGFFGLAALVGTVGLLFLGWKLATAPPRNDSGDESEDLAGQTVARGPGEDQDSASGKKSGGIVGWLRSANEKLDVLSTTREAHANEAQENLEPPKRPMLASQPISADERIYQQYINRKDVLVMVEYYADW